MGDVELLDAPESVGGRARKSAHGPAPASAPSLEYRPDPTRVSVQGFRLFLVLTLVNTTLLGMSVAGPQLFPFVRTQWQQWRADRAKKQAEAAAKVAAAAKEQKLLALRQQCLAFSRPPTTVVYDEDPAEGARRIREGSADYQRATSVPNDAPAGWIPPMKLRAPAEYDLYLMGRSGAVFGNDAVLFLHERRTPGGVAHLVSARFETNSSFVTRYETDDRSRETLRVHSQFKRRVLTVRAAVAGKELNAPSPIPPRALSIVLPDSEGLVAARASQRPGSQPAVNYGNVLRVFAGQPDPNDPTHFTIPYTLDGHAGVIDGWLKDDRIEVKPREGEWMFNNGEAWKFTPRPATRPAVYPVGD